MKDGVGTTIFLAICAVAAFAYNDTFYTTGRTWYEQCWKFTKASAQWQTPVAPDPYTDAIWQSCETEANRGFYGAGLLFAANPSADPNNNQSRLAKVCPSSWTDSRIGGMHFLAVEIMQKQGGPSLLDRLLPASWTVGRFMGARWPQCSAEKLRQGYPEIVQMTDGSFGWEKPCVPCSVPQQ